jgi:hypothetical protein
VFLTPYCASTNAGAICVLPNLDPGVFEILSAAGDPGSAPCAGIAFQIGTPNPAMGEVRAPARFPASRCGDGDHVETEEQVFTEVPVLHRTAEIAIGRGDPRMSFEKDGPAARELELARLSWYLP